MMAPAMKSALRPQRLVKGVEEASCMALLIRKIRNGVLVDGF